MQLWLLACGASAVILAATVGLLLLRRESAPAVPAVATAACTSPPAIRFEATGEEDAPPVVLWAASPARLFLDGVPAFSAPESPKRFPVGEHTLRLEAEGQEPFETRIRLEPWTPALLHAQVDPKAGLTLVRIGARCASCPAALGEESLSFERTAASKNPALLLQRAALALRQNRRPEAAQALRHVPPGKREVVLFKRLEAQVLHDSFQGEAARESLAALQPHEAAELPALVKRLTVLETAEAERRTQGVLTRWNRLTERFNALVERFGPQFPGPTDGASRRLGSLSVTFEQAARTKDQVALLQAVSTGEKTLVELVEQLKSLRPEDCVFQGEVYATATQ